MIKTELEKIVKQSVLSSVINNSAHAKGRLEHLYGIMLNDDQLTRYKPFNFIRNLDSITETTGLFRLWLVTKGRLQDQDDYNAAGKRVIRSLEKMCRDYEPVLPEGLKGSNSLMIMFRVFFVSSGFTLTASTEIRQTMAYISYILKTMLLLDLIFSSDEPINNHPPEVWLSQLLTGTSYDIDRVAFAIVNR